MTNQPKNKEIKHKPNCAIYRSCAVYHENGICPNPPKCDCGLEEYTSHSKGCPKEECMICKLRIEEGKPLCSTHRNVSQEKEENETDNYLSRFALVVKGLGLNKTIANKLANFFEYEITMARREEREKAIQERCEKVIKIIERHKQEQYNLGREHGYEWGQKEARAHYYERVREDARKEFKEELREKIKGIFNTNEMNEMEGLKFTEGYEKASKIILKLIQEL